jgi:hypothetical protein
MKKESNKMPEEQFYFTPAKVDPTMEDHSNDPFFVKKLEAAKKRFEKIKLPPDWKTRK